jgi:hypothetical protein
MQIHYTITETFISYTITSTINIYILAYISSTKNRMLNTADIILTLIRAAGGIYDFRNFEQV